MWKFCLKCEFLKVSPLVHDTTHTQRGREEYLPLPWLYKRSFGGSTVSFWPISVAWVPLFQSAFACARVTSSSDPAQTCKSVPSAEWSASLPDVRRNDWAWRSVMSPTYQIASNSWARKQKICRRDLSLAWMSAQQKHWFPWSLCFLLVQLESWPLWSLLFFMFQLFLRGMGPSFLQHKGWWQTFSHVVLCQHGRRALRNVYVVDSQKAIFLLTITV